MDLGFGACYTGTMIEPWGNYYLMEDLVVCRSPRSPEEPDGSLGSILNMFLEAPLQTYHATGTRPLRVWVRGLGISGFRRSHRGLGFRV